MRTLKAATYGFVLGAVVATVYTCKIIGESIKSGRFAEVYEKYAPKPKTTVTKITDADREFLKRLTEDLSNFNVFKTEAKPGGHPA